MSDISSQPERGAIREQVALLARALAVAAVTLLAFRIAFLLAHGKPGLPYGAADLRWAFFMGSRFDLKIGAILLGPVLLLLAAPRYLAPRSRGARSAPLVWAGLVLLLLDLVALANHFYYRFYSAPLNAIAFGLVEDDTSAILATLWKDYPVLRAVAGLAALLWAQLWLLRRPWTPRGRRPARGGWGREAAALLLAAAAVLFLARGRLGTFPLREADLTVASDPFVNDLVPSGPEALFVAWQQRGESALEGDVTTGLRRLGFSSPLEAAAALGMQARDPAELLAALYPRARANPAAERQPPHVVVALMESWGADALRYHRPGNDLLGRLAPHLLDGALFRRFIQIQDGTDGTVESLLLGTPIVPLTYGRYGGVPFDTSAALPYARRGYRTAFLTSGTGGWRNLRRVLPRQGFAEFYDEFDLRQAFPGAAGHTWGVHDEYMWRMAGRLIAEADRRGEKLFLVVLTTSNHPPHTVPPDYRPRPVDLAAFDGRLAVEPAQAGAMLRSYQYACDAFGGFLDELRASGLSERTLVAALGDHNTRQLFAYPDVGDALRRYGVPLFLHVPPAYLGERRLDTERIAGPRDLFPTLAGLAIPGERVLASGRDLTEPADRPRALTSYDVVISGEGVGVGLALAHPLLFRWDANGKLTPCEGGETPDAGCRAALEKLVAEERAYIALLDWNIRRQALGARR